MVISGTRYSALTEYINSTTKVLIKSDEITSNDLLVIVENNKWETRLEDLKNELRELTEMPIEEIKIDSNQHQGLNLDIVEQLLSILTSRSN